MTSPLSSLAELRKKVADKQRLKLEVPRWFEAGGVHVFITYQPASDSVIQKVMKFAGRKSDDASLQANYQFHVDTALEISFEFEDGQVKVYKGFGDEQLSEDLGVENASARNNAAALFITDGDVLALASKVGDWSGYRNQAIDEESLGE